MMDTTIAQRELRNRSGEILRAVESGQEFVVTVSGRPVARLSPYTRRTWVPTEHLRDVPPADDNALKDIEQMPGGDISDPWERP